ncbi:MAG TPA: AMP-binding protein [Lentimicrobium sp.]|nr:AMP-binding protein [Lentimicrobium sp.]
MGLLNFLNDTITVEDTYNYTLPEVLQTRAIHTPDKPAFIFLTDGDDQEERVTFKELDHAARSIAARLIGLNMKGERALMLYPGGINFIKALFGCLYAGIIAVPAYPPRKNRSLERLRLMVVDSGAKIVMATDEIFNASNKNFQDVEELKNMNWMITDKAEGDLPDNNFIRPGYEDIALLQYTSGSTGMPKGVMVAHSNIMRNCEFIRTSFSFSTQSTGVSWLPSFHDMGLVGQILQPVYTGFTSVLMAPVSFLQKPIRWMKAFSKYRGTMGGAPNFAFDLLADNTTEEEREGLDLSSIVTLYCGAEPIRKSTFTKFIETYTNYGFKTEMLYPCYGMAETTLITSGPPALRGPVYLTVSGNALEKNKVLKVPETEPDARHLVGVGYPWLDTTVRIVNPDTLQLSKPDEIGEIWINGSSVTKGYWNNKKVTDETFRAELEGDDLQYLRTGDLGFMHEGELYITGRLKDMIILHGLNYYPQDIELVAERSHEALMPNSSAAFSVLVDEIEKLVIVAEVKRSFLRDLDVHGIADAIRHSVSDEFELEVYGIQLLRTASILKTSSGKIQRKACKQGFLEKSLEVVGESVLEAGSDHGTSETTIDLTSVQAWLMVWIHLKLGVSLDRIDMGKNISAYGLNSLKAVQLQQDFLQKYGVNIPPYIFFEKMTVKDLSEKAYKMLKEAQSA